MAQFSAKARLKRHSYTLIRLCKNTSFVRGSLGGYYGFHVSRCVSARPFSPWALANRSPVGSQEDSMASQPSGTLFSLHEHGVNSWGRASAFVAGSYDLSASFRRGIQLGAGVKVTGEINDKIGGEDASVSASIDGSFSVGVSLDAAFPLDLFGQCGLIARLRAEAEAAAYFRANVDINSEGEAG